MSAKIPQDVTREDKLFGPLTLRQFLAILFASGVIFVVYQGYAIGYLYFAEFLAITVIVGIFALAWAFAKVNGRPFPIFITNLFHFTTTPKHWVWGKEDRNLYSPIKISAADIKTTRAEAEERKSGKIVKMQIEQLASVLDAGGTIKTDSDTVVASQVHDFNTPQSSFSADLPAVEDVLADTD